MSQDPSDLPPQKRDDLSSSVPSSELGDGPLFSDLAAEAMKSRNALPVLSDKDRQRLAHRAIGQLTKESWVPIGIDGLPDGLAPIVERPIAPKDLTVPGALLAHVMAIEDYERRIDEKLNDLASPYLFGHWKWSRMNLSPLFSFCHRLRAKIAWRTAAPMIRVAKMGEKIRSDKLERSSLKNGIRPVVDRVHPDMPRSHDFD